MPDTGPAQIMNDDALVLFLTVLVFDESRQPCREATRLPCLSKAADWLSVAMKDIRTIKTPPGFCPLDDCSEFVVSGSSRPFLFFDSSGGKRRLLPAGSRCFH